MRTLIKFHVESYKSTKAANNVAFGLGYNCGNIPQNKIPEKIFEGQVGIIQVKIMKMLKAFKTEKTAHEKFQESESRINLLKIQFSSLQLIYTMCVIVARDEVRDKSGDKSGRAFHI